MTTASTIITAALREANIIAVGTSPTSAEQTEALDRLNSILKSTIGTVVGYELENWGVTTSTSLTDPSNVALSSLSYIKPNSRMVCKLTSATALNLDPKPEDGQRVQFVDSKSNFGTYNLTVSGNGNFIDGASSLVLSANGTSREFLYRADTGNWIEIETLGASDTFPLPEDFDDYFITQLAIRLNPRYGREIPAETSAYMAETEGRLRDRYRQSRINVAGE